MLGWITVRRETMLKFAVSSIHSWVCGPPVVPENNGEIWVYMLLAPTMQCLSPGEDQPSFLFCRIISQSGQFPELAHPAKTSDRVERALLRAGRNHHHHSLFLGQLKSLWTFLELSAVFSCCISHINAIPSTFWCAPGCHLFILVSLAHPVTVYELCWPLLPERNRNKVLGWTWNLECNSWTSVWK